METDDEVRERYGEEDAIVCAAFRDFVAWIEDGPADNEVDYLHPAELLPLHGDWQSEFRLVASGETLEVDCHCKAFDLLDVMLEWAAPYAQLEELHPAHVEDLQAKRHRLSEVVATVLARIDAQLAKPRAK